MDESTPAQNQPKWLELPLMMTVAKVLCKPQICPARTPAEAAP